MEYWNYHNINNLITFYRNKNDKNIKFNKLTLVINKLFFRKLSGNLFILLCVNNKKCLNFIRIIFFFKNIIFFNFLFFIFKRNYLKANELELKGLNYRFTKLKNNLLLDLGWSHFQMVCYPILTYFFSLKKKKIKKILFINFNNSVFNITLNFFRFKLKKVGPYKLKGFQFIGERIKLKEGKKPFK